MTVATLARGQAVYLTTSWRGHKSGHVVVQNGQFVRVGMMNGRERLTHDFLRARVQTSEEFAAAREAKYEATRAAQATRVRFITLSPLWAGLMWLGVKVNETRTWPTKYRGWLGIHAGATIPREHVALARREPFRSVLAKANRTLETLPRSAIVLVARPYDCVSATAARVGWKGNPHELAFGFYKPGYYAWLLHQHRVLPEPIPAVGQRGFWDCDRLPTAINVALGEDLLPTTEIGRQAYYRGIGVPRTLEEAAL